MAIAHQTQAIGVANSVAGNYDTAITPAAAPNGVCVIIHQNASTADLVTSVTYGTGAGAVTLSRAASPYGFATEATEAGGIYIYWAGDSAVFPSGTQTVRIVRTGTSRLQAVISTMTVTPGQQVALDSGATGTSASAANPSWTHTSLVDNVMAYLGIHSGLTTMTNTPAAGWTLQSSVDIGAQGNGFSRLTSATNTAGNRGAGWTAATADDFRGSSIAFKEIAPSAVTGVALGAVVAQGTARGIGIRPGYPYYKDAGTPTLQGSDSASWSVEVPPYEIGDRLALYLGVDENPTITPAALADGQTWTTTTTASNGTNCRQGVFYIISTQARSTSQAINVALSTAQQGAARIYNLAGTHGTTSAQGNTTFQNTVSNPDPPLGDPASWGVEKTLWIALAVHNGGTPTVSAPPTGYTDFDFEQHKAGDLANGAGFAIAFRRAEVESEDPGTFTGNTSTSWTLSTFGYRPAPASAIVTGVAEGAIVALGTATGVREVLGSANGAVTAQGTAAGVREVFGSATGAVTAQGTAAGEIQLPAAIFDAASGGQVDALSSLTFSHTVANQLDRVLYVGVAAAEETATVTVTYNGVAMTSLAERNSNDQALGSIELFHLAAPAIGVHDVVVSSTIASDMEGVSASFYSADDALPTVTTAISATASVTASVTTTGVSSQVVGVVCCGTTITAPNVGTMSRRIENNNVNSGAGNAALGTRIGTGGSDAVGFTCGAAEWWAIVAAEVFVASDVQSGTFEIATITISAQDAIAAAGGVAGTFDAAIVVSVARDVTLTLAPVAATFAVATVVVAAQDVTLTAEAVVATFDVASVIVTARDITGGILQYLRPNADLHVGGWTTDTGATTNLFDAINEASPSHVDFIQSEQDPTDSAYVASLTPGSDPGLATGHQIVAWYRKDGTAMASEIVELRQGYASEASQGTLIASVTLSDISETETEVVYTLTEAEANAITSYTDLALRVVGDKT